MAGHGIWAAIALMVFLLVGVGAAVGASTMVDDFEDGDIVGWNYAPDGHNGAIEISELAAPSCDRRLREHR